MGTWPILIMVNLAHGTFQQLDARTWHILITVNLAQGTFRQLDTSTWAHGPF